ncbi:MULTISPECIES: superoxide dismutase [Roseomonas]|uniref:Superoxide dismutase n=5 Tax=Roseomonas TaxID=125216 RepID=A0A4Y1N018_9PROT|nr:superoxide dismutase [Roseomonas gilardii]APT57152.1 superoxide dismutase [Roseomonas gilardii]AWV23124.1 Superoxide dismutase [Roseomonas mucosa]PZR16364.1 MAG: superoxide dismutase [Azospirillum brasilense]SUE44157.1 Superoxide dismutase [Fe] [Roseomonas gilardii subsp. rosea]
MAFSLPPLPYDPGALAARGMCQETLELHHGKHHQAYVTALNGLIESKGLAGKSLEEIVAQAGKGGADSQPVLNQAGQHWNHILFWQVMSPDGGGDKLPGALQTKIDSDLGGLQKFKDDFKAAGVGQFGSGWAWLIQDASGKLKITKTPNGANPISTGEGTPLLGVDVWEHSYYLDFRNRRPDYLSNFLDKLVNWEFVASLLDKGLKSGQSA